LSRCAKTHLDKRSPDLCNPVISTADMLSHPAVAVFLAQLERQVDRAVLVGVGPAQPVRRVGARD